MKNEWPKSVPALLRLFHLGSPEPPTVPAADPAPLAQSESIAHARTAPGPGLELRALDSSEQKLLLQWARLSVETLIQGQPPPDPAAVPDRLRAKQSCFVTLSHQHTLRGCVGHVVARLPLHQAVIENARSAAARDPRFSPVQAGELPGLKIEISVLSEPQRLAYTSPEELLACLEPGRDGVLLQIDGRVCTFLPQVWTQVPRKEDFLDRLAEKGGFFAHAWRGGNVCISTYRVQVLEEPSPPGTSL